jgi:two-component system response regulator LytT
VDLIEEHHPDLVFLDVQMPGQDGFAVIQRLMDRNRVGTAAPDKRDAEKRESEKRGDPSAANVDKPTAALPHFVFATAYDQYAVRAFDVNAVDYLLKPFDRARVLEAVERVRVRLATSGSTGGSTADAESQAETQIEQLLRLLNRPQAAEPGRAPAKLIVQAQSRLLLVDQAEICFAAIDEGVIRVVTRAFEGQSKCRTLEELMELLDPGAILAGTSRIRGEYRPDSRSDAVVQVELPTAHER